MTVVEAGAVFPAFKALAEVPIEAACAADKMIAPVCELTIFPFASVVYVTGPETVAGVAGVCVPPPLLTRITEDGGGGGTFTVGVGPTCELTGGAANEPAAIGTVGTDPPPPEELIGPEGAEVGTDGALAGGGHAVS